MKLATLVWVVLAIGMVMPVRLGNASPGVEPNESQPKEKVLSGRPALGIPPSEIVSGAIGPFESHSDGYGNPGASGLGYIAVLTLGTGADSADLDPNINRILPFDKAESSDTYIGQINLIQASSFSGPNGVIWGLDVAKADVTKTLLFTKFMRDGSRVPVYDMGPLLDAGRRLFGTRNEPRYLMLPGSHIIAAYKSHTAKGPTTVWCLLALGIARHRDRDANVFMEACNELTGTSGDPKFFDKLLRDAAESIARVGENQNVTYKEIYVSHKSQVVPKGRLGTALAAVPYIVLARQAIPKEGPQKLLEMSLSDWEKELGLNPLSPRITNK